MSLTNEILFGSKADVERMLKAGFDVNEIDVYGFPPIIETAIANNEELAKLLIDHGADVNKPDVTGRTALHWAIDNNNLPLTKLLLENKANANAYTEGGQSVLVYPLLRNQQNLKKLLYQYKADLNFAQDFINGKLLGHRFQLLGQVDIVNAKGHFIELDFEGFFLEFTLGIIQHSLERYRNNFAARKLRAYFKYLTLIIDQFANAAELMKYQRYTIDVRQYRDSLDRLLQHDLLLIPVAYEGHAITFIKYGDLLARCDRGENSLIEGSVVIYHMNRAQLFDAEFIKQLMYKPQSMGFITEGIKKVLGLVPVAQLPLASQIIGNCSWANVEGAIPTMLYLLMLKEKNPTTKRAANQCKKFALDFYRQWIEWDQDRAIEECVHGFDEATPARKATKASILGAILFQHCNHLNPKDVTRAEKMLPYLMHPDYQYILKSYLEIYWRRKRTKAGQNLLQLLEFCGIKL